MATVTASPSPNPNAMKFSLDVEVAKGVTVKPGEDVSDPFTAAILATGGVAALFLNGDFVTVTRVPGADWDPIVAAVEQAAEAHL